MQLNDMLNGGFELGGGILLWMSVKQLWADREIKGVYWPVWVFYSAWGIWNLYYYPSISQWASFVGGILVVGANLTWCALATMLWLGVLKGPKCS